MAKPDNPFRWFDSSPEVIRTVVVMYVRFPLSLRQVEDLLAERGIDICHETVRVWWNRFGPMFAGEIHHKRVQAMRSFTHCRWRFDEVFIQISGERRHLLRAIVSFRLFCTNDVRLSIAVHLEKGGMSRQAR